MEVVVKMCTEVRYDARRWRSWVHFRRTEPIISTVCPMYLGRFGLRELGTFPPKMLTFCGWDQIRTDLS